MSFPKQSVEIKALAQQELGKHLTVIACLKAHPDQWIGNDAFTKQGKKVAKRLASAGVIEVGTHVAPNGAHVKAYRMKGQNGTT